MKTLINNTVRALLIYALPILFVASALLGFNLGYAPSEDLSENKDSIEFVMEEEAYIDDIPFDTEKIAQRALYNESQKETYQFEDEAYIDDIPFDTEEIALKQGQTFASAQ